MSTEDFSNYLKTLDVIEDQLVYIRYKYSCETDWTYANEILEVDTPDDYAWLNDWFEGQEDIEILGCIPITEIDVPLFETNTAKKE